MFTMNTPQLLVVVCIFKSVYLQNPGWLERGEICRKKNGEAGICTQFLECTSAIVEVSSNGRPEICSFDGKNPIVCCATNNSFFDREAIKDESKSNDRNIERKNENCRNQSGSGCGNSNSMQNSSAKLIQENWNTVVYAPFDENSKSLKACRMYHGRIKTNSFAFVGGRNSNAKEFPHMAVLGYGSPDNIQWQCGGTLISLQFVMTAAHCLFSRTQGQVGFVRLGELDLHSTTDDADPQDFTVVETHPHPDYTVRSKYNDIALLKLNRQARVTDYVKPACLSVRTEFINSPSAMGWGLTSRGGSTANILQVGYLRFVPFEKCKTIYGVTRDLMTGILDEQQLCADGGDFERDTCQGDSGGPLQVMNYDFEFASFPEIVGITSFGKECGLTAGVYTRVYHYVPWIEQIVFTN